jgi:hypothetical protein
MTDPAIPCVYFFDRPPSRCLVGRRAPHACTEGCAAYRGDAIAALSLDQAECTRREAWARIVGQPGAAGLGGAR